MYFCTDVTCISVFYVFLFVSYCVLRFSPQYCCIIYMLTTLYSEIYSASNLFFVLIGFAIVPFLLQILYFAIKRAVHLIQQKNILQYSVVYNFAATLICCTSSTKWPFLVDGKNCLIYLTANCVLAVYLMLKTRLTYIHHVIVVNQKLYRYVCAFIMFIVIKMPSK